MRIHNLFYLAFSLLLLASCASDNDIASDDKGGKTEHEGVAATVKPIEFDAASRSELNYNASLGLQFSWNAGDQLTILPNVDNTTRGIYTLKNGAGTPNARFACSAFSLSKSARYFAFSKTERETPGRISIPDKANITVDYSGQRQKTSGTGAEQTRHLGTYDFLASTATCSPDVEDQAYFEFQHLGITLFITMKNLPMNAQYKKLEIYDSKNIYRNPIRTIDLGKGFNESTGTFTPAYDVQDVQSEAYKTAPRFSLLLGENDNEGMKVSKSDGMTNPDGTDRGTGKLELFVELPPVNMTDNTFIFSLVPADNATSTKPYYMKWPGKEYKAGKAYRMNNDAEEVTTYEVSLKVNHDWQLGNAVPLSRATGDPGNEEKYEKPKYIYYVFCVDGKVKQVNEKLFNRVPAITTSGSDTETIPSTDWTTSSDKIFDTYKDNFTFSVDDGETEKSKNVYFVASTSDISSSFENITSETTEEQVQNLVYSIQNASSSHTALDASQTFLRDLYSTPWESQSTFIGALKDPYQDVILYHVAAKVDLKWNSSAMLSGNVSVNNVMSTNLSLFKPTANPTTGTANYTVANAIDEETMFNGRQVFYLPQFNTYNVTVGGNVQDGSDGHPLVTFSPATTNGFTSWLRWLKKY